MTYMDDFKRHYYLIFVRIIVDDKKQVLIIEIKTCI